MFEITSKIISAIDCIALNINQVDALLPYIRDIQQALNNYPNMPSDFQGLNIIKKWVDLLHSKQATDELTE